MRESLVLGTVLLFAIGAVACGERGDVASGPPSNVVVSGKVINVNGEASTIEVRGANDDGGVFLIAEETNLMNQNEKIRLMDLAPGWHVAVQAERRGDQLVATYVEVVDE